MKKISFVLALVLIIGLTLSACGQRANLKAPADKIEDARAY